MARVEAGPGQGELFDPGAAEQPFNLSDRKSFGGALNERHLGRVVLESFAEADLELVAPDQFREVLFTASARSESRSISGLAINAAEAESVPGSVNRLTRRVAERTENSRTRRGDTNAERRAQKANKSQTETLRGYLAKRDGVLRGLETERDVLEKVREGLRHSNLNRGYVTTVRMNLIYAVDIIFPNMLGVMADELAWDNKTRDAAKEAMRYQIIEHPRRFKYTSDLTKTAIQYTKARQSIFKGKYDHAERTLTRMEAAKQTDLLESN